MATLEYLNKSINLTAIAAKVYNTLLLNYIQLEIKKVLRKNQNSFWRNRSTTSNHHTSTDKKS